jgi:DNA adenine methylase
MQLGLALADTSAEDDLDLQSVRASAPAGQLLKWIGNKQRFALGIIAHFPRRFGAYYEPFLGSGAVLATLAPKRAEGSDIFGPLVGIWKALRTTPELVADWYRDRHDLIGEMGKEAAYAAVRDNYNRSANPADLLFLSRVCYGGVVRFRMKDGFMSTPCGPHKPMAPEKFSGRVAEWSVRTRGTTFFERSFEEALERARSGDVVYCDPPYTHSQTILYGAQAFSLDRMFRVIEQAKRRGVFVAVSIDGSKKSGNQLCDITYPSNLFAREEMLTVGRSMLRRFQMGGETLEAEIVRDRLLLTH